MTVKESDSRNGPAEGDVEADEILFGTEALLPRVQELLTRIPSADGRRRFECFFTAAAATIEQFGQLSLTDVKGNGEPAPWEELEPAVRSSLRQLRAFLDVVRREFPVAEEPESGEGDLDFSLDGPAPTQPAKAAPTDPVQKVAALLGSFCSTIGREMRLMEETLHNEALVSDPWNLAERLCDFRGRTRSGIGEMVFMASRLFAVVRKEDVVPFYQEDLDRSLALRRGVTTLRERLGVQRVRLNRLLAKEDTPAVRRSLEKYLSDVDEFLADALFCVMRPADQRACRQARAELAALASSPTPGRQIESSIDGLEKFLDSLSLVNHRELLLAHDREVVEDASRHLDTCLDAVAGGAVAEARERLRRTLSAAKRLIGREPGFDLLLRLLGRLDITTLGEDDILAIGQLLRKQLSGTE